MIRVPHSNLPFLKKEFADIILFEKETDQTGNKTTGYGLRRTFIFKDKSYLSITEYLDKDGTIGCFFYDWYDKDKEILAKFHSEAHRDKDYQTETEPYHIHSKGMLEDKRISNHICQDLFGVLEFIRMFLLIKGK